MNLGMCVIGLRGIIHVSPPTFYSTLVETLSTVYLLLYLYHTLCPICCYQCLWHEYCIHSLSITSSIPVGHLISSQAYVRISRNHRVLHYCLLHQPVQTQYFRKCPNGHSCCYLEKSVLLLGCYLYPSIGNRGENKSIFRSWSLGQNIYQMSVRSLEYIYCWCVTKCWETFILEKQHQHVPICNGITTYSCKCRNCSEI